jgi:aspartate aminotransferase-like enzyme
LKVETPKLRFPQEINTLAASGFSLRANELNYAAITLVYNETSTGVTNPLYDVAEMMKKKYPNVLVLVDAVSAMVGLPIHFDQLGWDVVLASVQKCFAIPPGLAVFAVSSRALEKSKTVKNRGYYFDFQEFAKSGEKNQTPTTPAIPHIMALNYQCGRLLAEGMENVWARHKKMAEFVKGWAKNSFSLFCDEKYASNTLTTVKNTRNVNIADVIKSIQSKHNVAFGNGYGKLKDVTFRIAHMGDITLDDMKQLTAWIDEEIGKK